MASVLHTSTNKVRLREPMEHGSKEMCSLRIKEIKTSHLAAMPLLGWRRQENSFIPWDSRMYGGLFRLSTLFRCSKRSSLLLKGRFGSRFVHPVSGFRERQVSPEVCRGLRG